MSLMTLKGWYQLDFEPYSPSEAKSDFSALKNALLKIDSVMSKLKTVGLVRNWFFLFEVKREEIGRGNTIRVRMNSDDRDALHIELKKLIAVEGLEESKNLPFSEYQEDFDLLFNAIFVEYFANVMCLTTEVTIAKLKNQIDFDNYGALERVHHCMFNMMAGLAGKREEHFLEQRILQRYRQPFDDDFEYLV